MKKIRVFLVVLVVIGLAVSTQLLAQKGDNSRTLTGRVTDKQDTPLSNAVVYLTNSRTRAVKTYIVAQDGAYRFPSLNPNIDYEVYAQYSGRKSDTKTVSQFDNRSQVTINLKIGTR
ncbi:MAG TPA: carboxypeptidase-like regulatory domain-containing protein [Terriglobales bacterium]|nr:carboxypeptidase-like regulatory domain-containing protein [Terriglobales bacterium]